MKHADRYGIRLGSFEVDFSHLMQRKNEVVAQLVGGIRQLLKANGVDVYMGKAKVMEGNRTRVNGIEWHSRYLLLATGSDSATLPIPGVDLPNVLDSRAILDIHELPEKIIIIGGGVIGIEFASIFNALGSSVSVLEWSASILPGVDKDISKRMTLLLKQQGVEVLTGAKVTEIRKSSSERLETIVVDASGTEKSFSGSHVLLATGRIPSFGGIDLERLGIAHDSRQGIRVNEWMTTNVDHIYAAGDVIGGSMLAHAASHEAITAVEHIAAQLTDKGNSISADQPIIPACIFSLPEIAMAGITEEQAAEKFAASGDMAVVSRFPLAANGRAQSSGEAEGFVKLVARQSDGVLLGVHILGAHASELIQEATLAIQRGLTGQELASTIHPHPTLSESVAEAALGLQGPMLHYFKST
jgi:dihydrolipoamide dehydrogenase